ncbi:MAG: class I SAM-dependent methyltransferase [Candidatus Ruthia sp.]|jgi:cyclopropane fatty-acyl-phospholipid synthase-like methyltransferase|nr:class I SAM-dependent methyltransferase [Candidatus Ruthturnera sp.]
MTRLYKARNKKLLLTNKLKALFIPNSLKRLSAKNELYDYAIMLKEPNQPLWELHSRLENIRHAINEHYQSYDYGNGYYYQSMKALNISGYRNTEERIEQLDLNNKVKGKSILDIGSNTGFVLLSVADDIKDGVGVELNKYLVETSNEAKNYLGVTNVEFIPASFEDYNPTHKKFDVVLSLANHSTFDGNTKQNVDNYFKKVAALLNDDGMLIFESHPPQIEPKIKLEMTLAIIDEYFDVEEKPNVSMEGFLDKNRTYVIARKKS